MPDFLTKQWQRFIAFWNDMPKAQKYKVYVMGGIVAAAIAAFLYLTLRVEYVPLFESGESVDMATVVQYLEDNAITYRKGDNQIFVDASQKTDIEFDLSTQGIVSPDVSFSDTWSQLSLTATEADKTHLWNEYVKNTLVYKLKKFDNVDTATIDFTKPEKSYWANSDNADDGTAYVMIKAKKTLTDAQVEGAALVVASSLGIPVENVNIVDENLNPLTRRDVNSELAKAGTQDQIRRERQIELEGKVYDLFKIGQADHANFDTMSVSANPVLDFDVVRSNSTTYADPNPDGGGFETASESSSEKLVNGTGDSVPGTDTNPDVSTYGTAGTGTSDYSKDQSVSDRVYNQTDSSSEKAVGMLVPDQSSLSISVWYGRRIPAADSLTAEYLDSIREAAATATGVPVGNITVNVQQLAPTIETQATLTETLTALLEQYGFYLFMLLMLVGLALTVMPKRKRDTAAAASGLEPALAGAAPGAAAAAGVAAVGSLAGQKPLEELPDLSIEEQSEIKKQIDKFVQQKPDAVAQLLRNWLSEDWE